MRWYKILVLVVTPGIIIGVVFLITPILSIDYTYAAHVPDEEECVKLLKKWGSLTWHGVGMPNIMEKKQFNDDNPGFFESTCWENRDYISEHFRQFHR